MKKMFGIFLLLLISCCVIFTAMAEEVPYRLTAQMTAGRDGSFIRFPVLEGGDPAVCAQLNALIREKASLDAYSRVLSSLSAGSVGLKVDFESNCSGDECPGVLSLLITASGKMPKGRPGTVQTGLTLDLSSGQPVSFSDLFDDPETALEELSRLTEEKLTPELSDYMYASDILPLPEDSFFLDGRGDLIFLYDAGDFSFVSGFPGAAAFSEKELSGIAGKTACFDRALSPGLPDPALSLIGQELEPVLSSLRAPYDSDWFPDGEAWNVEAPLFRGTRIVSRDGGQTVTDVLITVFFPEGTPSASSPPGEAADGTLLPLLPEGTVLQSQYTENDLCYTCFYDQEGNLTALRAQADLP